MQDHSKTTEEASIKIHPKFAPLYPPHNTYRYYVYHGGRCGLKSWAFAQAAIIRGSAKKLNILCAREIQKSIRESVHALLVDTIKRMGVEDQWEIQNDRILCRTTGSKINFIGLHNNTHNLKSYEGTHICWVEEAQAVTKKSWVDLDATIRWELKDKNGNTILDENGNPVEDAEIWISFNPDDEMDPTWTMFVANPRPNSIVTKMSWRDAEEYGWFPRALKAQMLKMKAENYLMYLNVWEGEPISNYEDAIIRPEWVDAAIDADKKLNWDVSGARIAAFDPADTGDDRAVVCRHGFRIEYLNAWGNKGIEESINEAYFQAFHHNCERLVYDADGLGVSMKVGIDRNQKEYKLDADAFHGGMGPDDPTAPYPPYYYGQTLAHGRVKLNKDTFRNKRAQYYWYLRDRFEATYAAVTRKQWIDPDRCISLSSDIPEDTRKQLRQELTRIRKKKSDNSSKITLESKADMKTMGIKSPNLADALMMVFANQPDFGALSGPIEVQTDWE